MTACGIIEANPYDVITYRERLKAPDIKIMADVQVKHAAMLAKRPIEESARETLHFGADELIITGRFTGDAPDLTQLKRVRKACPKATIAIGSGTKPNNFKDLDKYADKAIIGTYLKKNGRIEPERVKKIVGMRR